jgi:hypothetical protein
MDCNFHRTLHLPVSGSLAVGAGTVGNPRYRYPPETVMMGGLRGIHDRP